FEFAPGSVIVKDKKEHICVGFTGALPGLFFTAPPGTSVSPLSGAFGRRFWMLECTSCGSWHRRDAAPGADPGDCVCGEPLQPGRAATCVEPLGFRTDFRPTSDADSDGASGRHRSIQVEGGALALVSSGTSNTSIQALRQARTYRLNRGPADPA